MFQKQEPITERPEEHLFEIEPLEERIAPTTVMGYGFHGTTNQGPWVQTGDGVVFLGHDPA